MRSAYRGSFLGEGSLDNPLGGGERRQLLRPLGPKDRISNPRSRPVLRCSSAVTFASATRIELARGHHGAAPPDRGGCHLQAQQQPLAEPYQSAEVWSDPTGGTRSVFGSSESSAPLSHIGSRRCASLCDPAPAPGRQWLRYLCPTETGTCGHALIFTCAQ